MCGGAMRPYVKLLCFCTIKVAYGLELWRRITRQQAAVEARIRNRVN